MFGVEFVYGEAKQKSSQDQRFGETEQNKNKYWTLRETAFMALIFPVRKLAQEFHSITSPLKNQAI